MVNISKIWIGSKMKLCHVWIIKFDLISYKELVHENKLSHLSSRVKSV